MRRLVLVGLSLAGILDCMILTGMSVEEDKTHLLFNRGCSAVFGSSYAGIKGTSLPIFGILTYCLLLVLFLTSGWANPAIRRTVTIFAGAAAGAGFLANAYIGWFQVTVLRSFCFWSFLSLGVITTILVVTVPGLFGTVGSEREKDTPPFLRKETALLCAALLGVLFVSLITTHGVAEERDSSASEFKEAFPVVRKWSHQRGSVDAPIQIVEFGDFECPVCGQQAPSIAILMKQYGTEVNFIFRHFPLDEIHPYADQSAEASECAGEQGKFWEAYDKFYQEQSDLTKEALERYAGELGLNLSSFKQCVDTHSMRSRVVSDLRDARTLGVDSTPTFFVNGHRFVGLHDSVQFTELIKELQADRQQSVVLKH